MKKHEEFSNFRQIAAKRRNILDLEKHQKNTLVQAKVEVNEQAGPSVLSAQEAVLTRLNLPAAVAKSWNLCTHTCMIAAYNTGQALGNTENSL